MACLVSLLAGGSSLPLKLHEAPSPSSSASCLLGTVLVRRPLPVARVLKVPHPDRHLDASLSVTTGAFLVLYALLHVALAVSLSTDDYLVAGRLLNWASLAAGAACLYA